ncbi:hypothetical protein LS71_005280 [Helicobacter jaachi]|uniref:Uncharacterized protein n=1 Tax=Helicobacter jaachi TaxID=1677920 RepID=A0A4U8T9P9_9HELI|nr:hypothetical protein [Helicobacter jaachi]TLD96485.1 hypothetical protein LS71_005280 [Helicobacter jaachi]
MEHIESSNAQSIKRTHDEFYASESHKDAPKESFKYIAHIAKAHFAMHSCAGGGGSLKALLNTRNPKAIIHKVYAI